MDKGRRIRAIGGWRKCNNRRSNGASDEGARQVGRRGVASWRRAAAGTRSVVDGAPEAGGRNLGMRPMEMVLAGAAACTAFDVVWILKRARQPVADCVVDADAERAPVEPKVFTRIHLTYAVAGRGLDPHQVERAVKLSKEKYCSATHHARARGRDHVRRSYRRRRPRRIGVEAAMIGWPERSRYQ